MKDLATVDTITQLLKSQGLLAVVDGSIKQITMEKLMDSMNVGQEQLLRQVAWGTYIEYSSSTSCPQIGNLTMRDVFFAQRGRYLVKPDGTAAKLNPNNSAYFADGTLATTAANSYNTMWYSPELYYLVTTENGSPILWCSMIPIGGKKADAFCIGAYKGSMDGTKLISRPGLVTADSKTISQFWTAAQINGKNWGLMNYTQQRNLVMQFLGKTGNTDAQTIIGNGLDGTNSSFDYGKNIVTGITVSLGDASGSVNTTDSEGTTVNQISFDGIEGIWGQKWEFRQGILSNGLSVYIWDGNKVANDKPPVGVTYRTQTRLSEVSSYIKTMQMGDYFDIIPKTIGGGSTSYWADGHWTAEAGEVWLFGGSASYGSWCGLSASYAYGAFSFASSAFGARLAFYGSLNKVTGGQFIE